MPLSTWTTRSPTFRSRKSERNERLADRRRSCGAALLLEQVGLGEQPQVGGGQVEALRQPARRDEHGGVFEVVGVGDGARADVVVGEQLDRAFGPPRRGGDEHDAIALGARLPDFLDPVADAPVIRRGGTDGNMVSGIGTINRQFRHAPAGGDPSLDRRPGHRERVERGHRRVRARSGRPRSCATAAPALSPAPPHRPARTR